MIEEKDTLYDADILQGKILEGILENGINVVDPTSPFSNLLEIVTNQSSDVLQEMVANNSKIFPSLARTEEDLYHHMTIEEEQNMFASPSSTLLTFMLSKSDIENNGVLNETTGFYTVTIPKSTGIEVGEVKFTLLNDINISVKDNNSFVEDVHEEILFTLHGNGNIRSDIVTDVENVKWVKFDLRVYQIERLFLEDHVLPGLPWVKKIPLDSQYFFSRVSIKYQGSDTYTPVKITHSDSIYDPSELTVQIKVDEDIITYMVPYTYNLGGIVDGRIRVEMFKTYGKMNQPMKQFMSEEYSIIYPDTFYTETTTAIKYISVVLGSSSVLDGGVDKRSFRDMRNKIINRTGGMIDTPITERQLNDFMKVSGFTVQKVLDVLSSRIYTADKPIVYGGDSIGIDLDIFSHRVHISPPITNERIIVDGERIMIRPGTLFTENNGIVEPASQLLINDLNTKTQSQLVQKLNSDKILTTPFTYILDYTTSVINARVYDLLHPEVDNVNIFSKNKIDINVNIGGYRLERHEQVDGTTVIRLICEVIGNDVFETYTDGDMESVKAMMIINYPDTENKFYIYGDYVTLEEGKRLVFDIITDEWIDENHFINIVNGFSPLGSKHFMELETDNEIIIYGIKNKASFSGNSYDATERLIFPALETPDYFIAFTVQPFTLKLGEHLNYIWSMSTSSYTQNKYLKEDINVPLLTERDVYNVDPVTGCEVTITMDGNECTDVSLDINTPAGTQILDAEGNPIFIRRKGDYKIDEVTGEKIIDKEYGLIRFVDVLLYDYRYDIVADVEQQDYKEDIIKMVKDWIVNDIEAVNDRLLEQTKVLFKPRRSFSPVKTTDGNIISNIVKPLISVYIDDSIISITDVNKTETTLLIAKVLNNELSKLYIDKKIVSEKLEDIIGNGCAGVKISGLDPEDRDILSLDKYGNRLTLAKMLTEDKRLVYDFDIRYVKVN